MGVVVSLYKKNFLQRYDVPEAIPFSGCDDFPGLCCEQASFRNSSDVEIRYFSYFHEGYDPEKLVLLSRMDEESYRPEIRDRRLYCEPS